MISIIITAFKEEKTIQKAILSVAEQEIGAREIIVVAPDSPTLSKARSLKSKIKNLRVLQDSGEGKPSALNFAVSEAKGEIIVLTDGDVSVSRSAIPHLLEKFSDKKVGAVSGRPISTNPINTKYGYWSYLLTEIAHQRRTKAQKNKLRFYCTGYLFAIRKDLFPKLQKEILSEDGYISHKIYEAGKKIVYEPRARVYVKYPNNFSDWVNQKRRSAGGYNQIRKILGVEMRSLKKESSGALHFFRYANNLKEIFWLVELFIARLYLWWKIHKDLEVKRQGFKDIWVRIESTK